MVMLADVEVGTSMISQLTCMTELMIMSSVSGRTFSSDDSDPESFFSTSPLTFIRTPIMSSEMGKLCTPENSQLLHKGKYHCMAVLLFVLFGFRCFAYAEFVTYLIVWLNPNQSNRRLAVQWCFPYRRKWMFSGVPMKCFSLDYKNEIVHINTQ